MMSSGGSVQHRTVMGSPAEVLPSNRRPRPGPIAVLPESSEFFVNAINEAGGTVGDISDDTRGILWLSYARAGELSDVLDAHPNVDWVQLPWAGVDAFSEVFAKHSGLRPVWTSAKGAYAEPVAEHALAIILALLRQFPQRSSARSWGAKSGTSLYGLNVVIVGAGGVALELMRLLQAFRTTISIVRRSDSPVAGAERTVSCDRLHEVLANADVVVLAAAMTVDSQNLIGAAELALMKSSSILVNVARGGLVDTEALVAALATGEIAGAGLDVTTPEPLPDGHPLWSEPRALITPHSADTPEMTRPLLAERVKTNVRAFMEHSRFVGLVDPEAGY